MTDFTVSNALTRCFRALGQLRESIVDSTSSTTTIVDTKLAGILGSNNAYKNGTAIIIRTTDALAPQGEFNRISASDNATYKLTVDTAFTAAPGSGDVYGYANSSYPLQTTINLLNDALRSLGMIDLTDTTTITIASEKSEYSGSVSWKRTKPFRIEIATDTDTNDYKWKDIYDWDYIPAVAGTAPTIIFKKQYSTSYPTVKVWYRDLHPEVTTYSSKIREELHPELVTAAFVVKAMGWYMKANEANDDIYLQNYNEALQNLEHMRMMWPLPRWNKAHVKTPDLVF
ncbi:MAG: hypothetical protein KKD77_24635 [Gammaproteobacteria bacterium]|nr:hypothetical protein [Gammaproteobacteria bacterium]